MGTGVRRSQHRSHLRRIRADTRITLQDVVAALDDPTVVRLDVRSKAQWAGQSASPVVQVEGLKPGRTQGATWFEWLRLLTGPAAPGLTDEIQLYCFKGSRVSAAYVAMTCAGLDNTHICFSRHGSSGARQ